MDIPNGFKRLSVRVVKLCSVKTVPQAFQGEMMATCEIAAEMSQSFEGCVSWRDQLHHCRETDMTLLAKQNDILEGK